MKENEKAAENGCHTTKKSLFYVAIGILWRGKRIPFTRSKNIRRMKM